MEEGLDWEMIICIEVVLLIFILITIFYGIYLREYREIEAWKEKNKK